MADDYQVQVQSNGNGETLKKPLLELYVKVGFIRYIYIHIYLFIYLCSLFTCFRGATYTDNREIEGRIFHLAKEFRVPLFEKDPAVEKRIESLYRVRLNCLMHLSTFLMSSYVYNFSFQNFKLFLRSKSELDKGRKEVSTIDSLPPQIRTHYNRVVEQLAGIDQLLAERQTRYLLGASMTEYDCELMPRLHHMRIVGQRLLQISSLDDLICNKVIILFYLQYNGVRRQKKETLLKRGRGRPRVRPQLGVNDGANSIHGYKFTNADCLKTYRNLKSLAEFVQSFSKDEQEKFIRGALKANHGSLECFLCDKELSSSLGLVIHLKKCKQRFHDRLRIHAKIISKRDNKFNKTSGGTGKESVKNVVSLQHLKEEPSIWLRLSHTDKIDVLHKLFPSKISCFAFGNKDCPIYSNSKEAILHLDNCIQHMYFTFKAMVAHGQLPCLECGKMYHHQYGLIYHLDRCNVNEGERPWKCYRCGFNTSVAKASQHLDACWAENGSLETNQEGKPLVLKRLGDINLRSGKSVVKENETKDIRVPALESALLESEDYGNTTVLYCGGPINAIRVAPNQLSEGIQEGIIEVLYYLKVNIRNVCGYIIYCN
uniref:C2H2-type domain-containing protein n=1 Tax=Heterorhabditis bacteriophora TaxID=37862 RepID=A0A1I7X1I7_HETBA